jgi:hypothetical protein
MRRWLSAGAVLVVLSVGLAGSAIAAEPGPINVPAMQASVKDQCTGGLVPGFAASLVAATGATPVGPSKTTASGFVFQSGPANPDVVLHVTAPGYVPLGGAADPGFPISADPGPINVTAVQRQGPIELPDGVEMFTGVRLAVLLAPTAGCPTPLRAAAVTALSGKVVDVETGTPIPDAAVSVLPDPATPGAIDPGPVTVVNGAFKVKTLECGAYDFDVTSTIHKNTSGTLLHEVGHNQNLCHGGPGSGDIAAGTTMVIALPALGLNRPPVIDWTTASAYATNVGNAVHLNAAAHDPDPADNLALTDQWSSTDGTCTFTTPTTLATDVSCGVGNALITLTVTDPHAATATASFVLLTLPVVTTAP